MEIALKLEEIVKTYGKYRAVNGVSFQIEKGCIFGLLGPNGAGKTSIIRMITGITGVDTGRIFLDGEPLNGRHPTNIGYMPEERGLYKKMKVGEHLLYLARLKGLGKKEAEMEIGQWLEKFNISDWQQKKVEELSKGMQQKIQFISTVVHRPKLLILDEPFSGLDPINTQLIQSEILALKEQGASIIFSTHRMEQVEEICEHIVLINKGHNILEGRVGDIKQRFKEHLFSVAYEGSLPERLRNELSIVAQKDQSIVLKSNNETGNGLLRLLMDHGLSIVAFQEILPSLSEIFIRQVKNMEAA
ncbi:MAG TPA: ATP-binding cassette domain-containing protein [Saprospiraceae bacterium]|nr:ATP-binding cassette domain-containing protein [Saprospiraceae bacterium]HMQ85916.1 ATP-binding cassette domain-containing protein [Saprospiraceae bacterium]